MAKTYSISDFEPKASHSYFIDANMLLFVFSPIGNYKVDIQQKIANFIENSRKVGAGLVVTSGVISEFYNKNLKDYFSEWQQHQSSSQTLELKKHYRQSEGFKTDTQAIQSAVKTILKLAERYPDDFNSIDMEDVLNNSYVADYNDAYFLTQANKKQWMILSNDRDIINHPNRRVDVVTSLSF